MDIFAILSPFQPFHNDAPGANYPNNLIQSVSGELFKGVLNVEIGPPGVLGLSDIIEQMRTVRYVPGWKLPSGRSTGTSPGASTTALANVAAKENTIPGFQQPSLHSVSGIVAGKLNLISQDAPAGVITLKQLDAVTGGPAAGALYITLDILNGQTVLM